MVQSPAGLPPDTGTNTNQIQIQIQRRVSQVVKSAAGLPSKTKNYHGQKLTCQDPDEKFVKRNFEVSGIGGRNDVKDGESNR